MSLSPRVLPCSPFKGACVVFKSTRTRPAFDGWPPQQEAKGGPVASNPLTKVTAAMATLTVWKFDAPRQGSETTRPACQPQQAAPDRSGRCGHRELAGSRQETEDPAYDQPDRGGADRAF